MHTLFKEMMIQDLTIIALRATEKNRTDEGAIKSILNFRKLSKGYEMQEYIER